MKYSERDLARLAILRQMYRDSETLIVYEDKQHFVTRCTVGKKRVATDAVNELIHMKYIMRSIVKRDDGTVYMITMKGRHAVEQFEADQAAV